MRDRARLMGLLGASLLLVLLDVAIRRVDVFSLLQSPTRPTTLFASITAQLTDVVRALYGPAGSEGAVVFLGNSQTEALVRPLHLLGEHFQKEGAAPETEALSLCVFATAPTDAEVLTRHLGRLRPQAVVLGLSTLDLGTPISRAREMPLTALLDVGWRDGLLTPPDGGARLDRWARTGWQLYRYRRLFHDVARSPEEQRTPASWLDQHQSLELNLRRSHPPQEADRLLALRARYERTGQWDDFEHYLVALRGPDYLAGLRERWRSSVQIEPVQLEALRRMVSHVRRAGARPVWVLVPENPWLSRDPEIGDHVRRVSDATAKHVTELADALDVPLLDLRHALPAAGFLDLNHAVFNRGDLIPELAARLGALLWASPDAGDESSQDQRAAPHVVRKEHCADREEVKGCGRRDHPAHG